LRVADDEDLSPAIQPVQFAAAASPGRSIADLLRNPGERRRGVSKKKPR